MSTSSVGDALGSFADQLEEDRRTRHWQVERTAVRLKGVSRECYAMMGVSFQRRGDKTISGLDDRRLFFLHRRWLSFRSAVLVL